jgi:hypothetical protein
MINWINGWKATNKKEKYEINIRIGTLTVLEIMFCPCDMCDRLMLFNLGFEI